MSFDLVPYLGHLEGVRLAQTAHEKGQSFEKLTDYLLSSLEGVIVTQRDVRLPSEEIDLVLWNPQLEEVLRPWDAVILVECKNWSGPVGAPQLDSFIGKMRRKSLKTGIFVAANGVTGQFLDGPGGDDGARGLIKSALQEGIRVIVITLKDLENIQCVDDLRFLIRNRYCGIFLGRVL